MRRFIKICNVFLVHVVFYKFTVHRKEILGVRLKMAFESLGITFIKMGQILSMRYDLMSKEDCEALQGLLDKVSVIPNEEIMLILAAEYGDAGKVFDYIHAVPLGSASVSQVHKAELSDGTIVAVKIKRPEVDKYFLRDIAILKKLALAASCISPTLRRVQVRELVGFFESWIRQDMDFELEVKNMEKVKKQYSFGESSLRRDLGKVIFIQPYKDLCTKNVIVMEYVDGIPMSRKHEILNNPEYDIEKSIKTYVNAATINWFRDDIESYIFQGDPHLSNIMALPNGDAANIDCGLIAELTKKEARLCKDLIVAVYMKDVDAVLKIAAEMTGTDDLASVLRLKPDLEIYLKNTDHEGIGFWFMEFIKIMLRHKIKFPLYLTTFGRTNIILDGLIKTYLPGKTTIDILGEELRRQAIKETFARVAGADWFKVAYALGKRTEELPHMMTKFIDNPIDFVTQIARSFPGKD